MSGSTHQFASRLRWTGAAAGAVRDYESYSRAYVVEMEGKPPLHGSAALPFRGDAAAHNPEDLLMAALSACHFLSYAALCARHGVVLVAYEDAHHECFIANSVNFPVTNEPEILVADA